ncbi:MAG TPA: SDR family NAD(P)-dependent oxidoreductase [Ktedonobacteraceae bacterium]|nr:SDR family NAD(P)-dependent oxidoreductase [Ktedonobacteraceae bacterium]
MKRINKNTFGPWALVTGASSGIGKEFARQLAQAGLNLVLVARRLPLLEEVGRTLANEYGIRYCTLALDLSEEHFLEKLEAVTRDLDIGLVVSNAGAAHPGTFLSHDPGHLHQTVRLSVLAHMDLAHHFGKKLAARKRGGIILLSGMGASQGVPYMANDSATRAYVLTLGETLNFELKKDHVHVTVLLPGPTFTPLAENMGFDARKTPLSVEQTVSEGLAALIANRPSHLSGVQFRIMNRLMPRALFRAMNGTMLGKVLTQKQKHADPVVLLSGPHQK